MNWHRLLNTVLSLAILICLGYACHFYLQSKAVLQPNSVDTLYVVPKYDSAPRVIRNTVNNYPRIRDSFPYPVPADVDTAAILARYYTAYHYSQTVRDSNLELSIADTITENRIAGRGITYKLLRPTKIAYLTQQAEARRRLYAGAWAGYNGKAMAGPQLLYIGKKDIGATIGYDMLNRGGYAGFYWKLGKK